VTLTLAMAPMFVRGPTPEDFTVFEWNANIAEIWDQVKHGETEKCWTNVGRVAV
jgi:hypothetical protein